MALLGAFWRFSVGSHRLTHIDKATYDDSPAIMRHVPPERAFITA
jgi:hypothetical protein